MQTTSPRVGHRLALLAAAPLLAIALASCAGDDTVTAEAPDLAEFDQGTGAPGVLTAEPGDCLDATNTVIDCGTEHLGEVFYTFNLPEGDFPGEDEVVEIARDSCGGQFEAYVGATAEGSQYDVAILHPSQSTWDEAGDSEVICILSTSGQTTGTAYQSGS